MEKIRIALANGDGSGPEMMKQATRIAIEAAKMDGFGIEFIETPFGWEAYYKFGDTFPEKSFKTATEIGLLFFGGVGDFENDRTIGVEKPEMKPEARCLLPIRKEWGLLLNFRPMTYYKSLDHLAKVRPENIPDEGVKQIWIRFLLEDSYFGNRDFISWMDKDTQAKLGIMLKNEVTEGHEMIADIAYYQKSTIEKYLRVAFSHAMKLGLPLISIDKANVMSRYDFWRKICTRIGREEFPNVPLQHQLVDSANALLFEPAKLHGVIACGNEHGDILSDGAAGALGSMGLMCSSAVNPDTGVAMFESGGGTAPLLRGKDKANPIGRILTAAMMLRHIGAEKGATAIEKSVNHVLKDGYKTADLISVGDTDFVGTSEMGELIFSNLSLSEN
jgi:3-isopropylmalate dehydrogenase